MQKYRPAKARPAGKIRIGWSGSHHTNVYALPLLKEPLEKLSLEADFEFVVISDKDPCIQWKNVQARFIQWKADQEVEQLQWIDIGLMPLKDGPFERGKCALKAVQYMAIAIPPVVSPVGVNELIVRDGRDGYHFINQQQLLERLRVLMTQPEVRLSLGKQAYENVVANYSVEVLTKVYEQVFKEVNASSQ
jgi:glycosyltransferase involved in cell wall biosynthesis